MPMMNAAQVRALSVEDLLATVPLFNPQKVPKFGGQSYCQRHTKPSVYGGLYITCPYEAQASVLGMIEWLMAVHALERQLETEAEIETDDGRIEVFLKASRPTTEEERTQAQAWLDNQPKPEPIKWRKPIASVAWGAYHADDAATEAAHLARMKVQMDAITKYIGGGVPAAEVVNHPADEDGEV